MMPARRWRGGLQVADGRWQITDGRWGIEHSKSNQHWKDEFFENGESSPQSSVIYILPR